MKLYQTPTFAAVDGVPENLRCRGERAERTRAIRRTAKERMAMVDTRNTRARFLDREWACGSPVESQLCGVAHDAARTRTPKIPYRLTRSWSAIACMRLVDATDCLRCEARAVNKALARSAKCLHASDTVAVERAEKLPTASATICGVRAFSVENCLFRVRAALLCGAFIDDAAGSRHTSASDQTKNETRFFQDF